jgi:organic radical activating enzyme
MGISQQPPKIFPVKKGIACQLKWTHSTVYLTDGYTASCHRAGYGPLDLSGEVLGFHNIPNKIEERKKMLKGEWPGNGCEHCKHIEQAGGASDRTIHLNMEGTTAPPELEHNLDAVELTPRILEVYWGNTCNLKCIYCSQIFSSKIHQEEKRFGPFNTEGVVMDAKWNREFANFTRIEEATEKLFLWFEKNIHHLHKLIILGGEPFIQKETERMIAFLEQKELPDLTLCFFSNLTVDHERVKNWVQRLNRLVQEKRLDKLQIIGSLDSWGAEAEYVRNGLDLKLFQKNFEYILNESNTLQNINSALTATAVPGMPELVKNINKWSKIRPVYWSMMKASTHNFGPRPYLYPGIFGRKINDIGLKEAVDLFDVNSHGYPDSVKLNHKNYMNGIMNEFENRQPDLFRQKQFKIYLTELDRRRGTDYKKTFPTIAEWLDKV